VCLHPKMTLMPDQLGQQRATCAAWSPHHPHDLILIGTHQGHVVVVRLHQDVEALHTEAQSAASVCSNVKVAGGAMRCMAWAPAGAFPAEKDCKHLCVVGSSQGFLVIYDIRDPFQFALDLTTAPRSTLFFSNLQMLTPFLAPVYSMVKSNQG
jgi:hypothetical protein